MQSADSILAIDSQRRRPRAAHNPLDAPAPESMYLDPAYSPDMTPVELKRLRCRHDFEFWAATCVRIRHKISRRLVPFVLNAPQRTVLAAMEADRLAGRPIRIIILKARQWGGSTLVQVYMAWIQCVHRKGWNSVICSQVGNTSATLRQFYSTLLANYPEELWEGDPKAGKPALKAVTGAPNSREVAGRDCTVSTFSSWSQNSARGICCSMAHLSEVAFWKESPGMSPEDLVASVCSGVPLEPLTLIALESTANGAGSFFHSEWLRAKAGESAFTPVFVPWHEIEMYDSPEADPAEVWPLLTPYERTLWESTPSITLSRMAWYHGKCLESGHPDKMKAEFPSTPEEAFIHSGCSVFAPEHISLLAEGCRNAGSVGEVRGSEIRGAGALAGVEFHADSTGSLKLWQMPQPGACYTVAVDVGGRSYSADWSVIAVLSSTPGERPEVVAQWRGHIDHDLLAWKAAAIASYYNKALLVIESNTLESELHGRSALILEELAEAYPRLYCRRRGSGSAEAQSLFGFHTNRTTKPMIIDNLIAAVRDRAYIERDLDAIGELSAYRQQPDGSFAASGKHHDDILMTRAIALFTISKSPQAPAASLSTSSDHENAHTPPKLSW